MRVVIEDPSLNKPQVTIYGASSDTKPTNYADGSIFIETNTKDVYMYDEKNSTWRKW